MSYNVINSFKFGLDTRRSELTSVPGTLEELRNAHVNQGGEVEKRKAFVRTAFPLTQPNGVFGLQETRDSIVVFGSDLDSGGWPPNITYQRLVHPFYAISKVDAVLYSTTFNNKIFVIARFVKANPLAADPIPAVLAFYDGVSVADITNGVIYDTTLTSNPDVALLIAQTINQMGGGIYSASTEAPPNDSIIDVEGQAGSVYTIADALDSVNGHVSNQLVSIGEAPITGVAASGAFQISSGTEGAGNQITQISVGGTNLLTAAVLFNDSVNQTATDVAAAIDSNSLASGYTATANGSTVSILSSTVGASFNNNEIIITSAGNVCIGVCSFSLTGTGFVLDYVTANGTNLTSPSLTYPQSSGQTLGDFCSAVASNINAGTATHGYLANSVSNTIHLSKAITSSSDPSIPVQISVTPTAGNTGGGVEGDIKPLTVGLSSTVVLVTEDNGFFGMVIPVYVNVNGGVPPYTYLWSLVQANSPFMSPGLIGVTTPTFQLVTTAFSFLRGVTAYYACEVTDSVGTKSTSPQLLLVFPT